MIVQQNLLHDEDGHSLAQFRSSLHNAKAERNDLGSEKEIDHIGRIVFDKRSYDTERCETKVFEWSGLGSRVEERIEEEWNMR